MTPKELHEMKVLYNTKLEEGRALWKRVTVLHAEMEPIYATIQLEEGDDFDEIPHIFGAGFYIDEDV